MISINRFHEMLLELKSDVNNLISPGRWILKDGYWIDEGIWDDDGAWMDGNKYGRMIDEIMVSPTEKHLVHKLKDTQGIVLAVKMPNSDTDIASVDNYSENNHCLFFLIEKIDPGEHDNSLEREHYAKIQSIMKFVKEWLLDRGLNGNVCGGDETISKPFHTEWEYQYEGHNGLSISFDLKDFAL
jgi:hypothetical protein